MLKKNRLILLVVIFSVVGLNANASYLVFPKRSFVDRITETTELVNLASGLEVGADPVNTKGSRKIKLLAHVADSFSTASVNVKTEFDKTHKLDDGALLLIAEESHDAHKQVLFFYVFRVIKFPGIKEVTYTRHTYKVKIESPGKRILKIKNKIPVDNTFPGAGFIIEG